MKTLPGLFHRNLNLNIGVVGGSFAIFLFLAGLTAPSLHAQDDSYYSDPYSSDPYSDPASGTGDDWSDPYADDDGDGIPNDDEEFIYGTNPLLPDSDFDGLTDSEEIGGVEVYEVYQHTDWVDDGFGNITEENVYMYWSTATYTTTLDPTNPDSDGDQLPDGFERDYGTNPEDPADAEYPSPTTGLSFLLEYWAGTEYPYDSDGDGHLDHNEIFGNSSAHDPNDVPADTTTDDSSTTEDDGSASSDGSGSGDGDATTDPGDGTNPDGDSTDTTTSDTDTPSDTTTEEETDDWELDTDTDGIPDLWEALLGLDPNDPNDAALNSDDDELPNWAEDLIGTDKLLGDTDGDSYSDSEEWYGIEKTIFVVDETTGDTVEQIETYFTDPLLADTDGDLLPDNVEIDELENFDPTDSADGDADNDNDLASNGREYQLGTLWDVADTDGGGVLDGIEDLVGTDPLNDPLDDTQAQELADQQGISPPSEGGSGGGGGGGGSDGTNVAEALLDSDGDGIDNATEIANGTDPNDPNSTVPAPRCPA